jgi:hypothetical protein
MIAVVSVTTCLYPGYHHHGTRSQEWKTELREECVMSCRVCASENQSSVPTEIAIHLPGLSTPHVFLFPQVVVCLDCGFTEFSIPETELPRFAKKDSTRA